MRTPGKKLIHYTSRNSLLKEINSKLSSPNKSKNVQKVSINKRSSFKPQSHMGKVKSRKNAVEKLQKICEGGSDRPQSSLKLVGKKLSSLSRGENSVRKCSVKCRRKRQKRRKKKKNVVRDEASCLQRRARYLLIKMKLEQNLIDAYSGEGWKGQSKEKIKPEKELERAETQILRCKLGIRDTIRQLDMLSSQDSIEDSVVYPDGSVFHEHIFCAKCKSREAFPDNDIILCDGTCNCGFHQKCLDPPLERIPPGEQGWLCKICECKMEILEAINAHIGTSFTVNSIWEEIFKEATAVPDTGNTPNAEEWPSEDSEDEDYYPEKTENSNSRTGIEEIVSDDASSSSSLFCSSDEVRPYPHLTKYNSWDGKHRSKGEFESVNSMSSIGSGEASDCEITSYRRQRRDVDYKKLYDEMFGKELNNNEEQSEDEDWGPHRRKRRRRDSDAGAIITNTEDMVGCSNVVLHENYSIERRTLFRIPRNAVEKLRQVFAENELPSRAVKENLSNQLGISSEKIGKWFKNARYAALKIRKAEMINRPETNTINKASRTNTGVHRTDGVVPMDDSYLLPLSSIVRIPKNLRRILQRKKRRSVITCPKKAHEGAANELPSDNLKKLTSVIAENHLLPVSCRRNLGKSSDIKRTTSLQVHEFTKNEQIYLHEMERLFSLEDRLRQLRKTLLTSKDNHGPEPKNTSREQCMIYVPVAEVKEKS